MDDDGDEGNKGFERLGHLGSGSGHIRPLLLWKKFLAPSLRLIYIHQSLDYSSSWIVMLAHLKVTTVNATDWMKQ